MKESTIITIINIIINQLRADKISRILFMVDILAMEISFFVMDIDTSRQNKSFFRCICLLINELRTKTQL